ncbi:Uncharacterised protein [Providencia rustigianii]|uniref:Uncharacterized protein n=1 Tax=Providencia rustigianii TaxID=158850 RepID=A0A379G544_9GAMM|nr:Uncharacterised protein [Providencia rustigianii]VEB70947.1 Uncharacterised protein [Providencia rustigianii]
MKPTSKRTQRDYSLGAVDLCVFFERHGDVV